MKVELLKNERVDDLQCKGLKIIQKIDGFCFGVDAVLLSDFVDIKRGDSVIDLGTGTGIIPVLLAGKTEAKRITGIEIQEDMVEMASRSVRLNELEQKIEILHMDLRRSLESFKPSSFDVVISNPPYMNVGGGLINPLDKKAIARHEIMCTLEDVIRVGSRLLKPGGQFAMVHRPSRLVDIMCLMRANSIEPKYIRFVHPAPYKMSNLMLVKGTRGGNPQLKMLEPLYVYDENGKYSAEIDRIYQREVKTVE